MAVVTAIVNEDSRLEFFASPVDRSDVSGQNRAKQASAYQTSGADGRC